MIIILYYPCTNLDLLILFLFSLHFPRFLYIFLVFFTFQKEIFLSLHQVVGYLLVFTVALGLLEYVGESALATVLGEDNIFGF